MEVRRLELPLPGLGIGSVNIYLINRGLVDIGLYSMRSFHSLVRGLKGYGLRLCDVDTVIVTHFHVDHLSLLPILWDTCGVKAYMGWRDLEVIKRGATGFVSRVLELFKLNGVVVEEIESMVKSHPIMGLREVYEDMLKDIPIKPLRDGDSITLGDTVFKIVEAPGHTPGSIILVGDNGAAFVGDVLINTITPHVIAHTESPDPLGDHMESLRRIAGMSLKIAYSGHRDPIEDPGARAMDIIRFHEKRLAEILEHLKGSPRTAYDIAKHVRWRVKYDAWNEFPPHERFFAIGEAIAHLAHLKREKRVNYYEEQGIPYWYTI